LQTNTNLNLPKENNDIVLLEEQTTTPKKKNNDVPNEEVIFMDYDDTDLDDLPLWGVSKRSDRELFSRIADRLNTKFPGISAIMMPDGKILARALDENGNLNMVKSVAIAGNDILFWPQNLSEERTPDFMKRTDQAFGKGTTKLINSLSIGVVGVSGTGSPTAEMLYRLGVGELVLVDDDIVKEVNLGRIYNSTMADAQVQRSKVETITEAFVKAGLPTRIVSIPQSLYFPDVVRRLAQCDIIFGCMDSVEGRDPLNRLCVHYNIPYFDLGVKLKANGSGGVDQVCGTVHYLQPDGSSLLSRRVYTPEKLRSENIKRKNPDEYQQLLQEKYIEGANEGSPAVISVNTMIASLAVNEFLTRIHPIREDQEDNKNIASLTISLTQTRLVTDVEGEVCPVLAHLVGRADLNPLLGMQELSEGLTLDEDATKL
jgi:ThiF family